VKDDAWQSKRFSHADLLWKAVGKREKHGRRLPLGRDNLIIFMRGGRDKDWPLAKQSSPEEGLFGQNAEIYYNNITKLFLDIRSM
jgi:hypothetical protein